MFCIKVAVTAAFRRAKLTFTVTISRMVDSLKSTQDNVIFRILDYEINMKTNMRPNKLQLLFGGWQYMLAVF